MEIKSSTGQGRQTILSNNTSSQKLSSTDNYVDCHQFLAESRCLTNIIVAFVYIRLSVLTGLCRCFGVGTNVSKHFKCYLLYFLMGYCGQYGNKLLISRGDFSSRRKSFQLLYYRVVKKHANFQLFSTKYCTLNMRKAQSKIICRSRLIQLSSVVSLSNRFHQ